MTQTSPSELRKALRAIAWGYDVDSAEDTYIIVENPDFEEDNGENPNLVIDVNSLPPMYGEIDLSNRVSLPAVLAIIDTERGEVLDIRKNYEKGSELYRQCSARLRLLNKLKKEFSLVSDAEQLPLGL